MAVFSRFQQVEVREDEGAAIARVEKAREEGRERCGEGRDAQRAHDLVGVRVGVRLRLGVSG